MGGQTPVHDEIVLQLGRMNRILGFDDFYGVLSAEAGCILKDL